MSLKKQKYVLLESAVKQAGTSLDHLLENITDGHIAAYVKTPAICSLYCTGLSKYSRAVNPVIVDGVLLSCRAVIDGNGQEHPAQGFWDAPMSEVRVDIDEVREPKKLKPQDVFYSIAERVRDGIRGTDGKVTHLQIIKELRRLSIESAEVGAIIQGVDMRESSFTLTDDREIPFKTFTNRVKLK